MVLALLVMIGGAFVGGIILGIANIVSGGKILGENQPGGYYSDEYDQQSSGFFDHDSNNSNKGIHARIVILSTIIGKAVSTGKMRTMMDMMIGMTAFGTRESFNTSFCFSNYQFKI